MRTCRTEAQQLVLDDAGVRELHLALLTDAPAPAVDPLQLWSLRERVKRRETTSFSRDDWALLLSDPETCGRCLKGWHSLSAALTSPQQTGV